MILQIDVYKGYTPYEFNDLVYPPEWNFTGLEYKKSFKCSNFKLSRDVVSKIENEFEIWDEFNDVEIGDLFYAFLYNEKQIDILTPFNIGGIIVSIDKNDTTKLAKLRVMWGVDANNGVLNTIGLNTIDMNGFDTTINALQEHPASLQNIAWENVDINYNSQTPSDKVAEYKLLNQAIRRYNVKEECVIESKTRTSNAFSSNSVAIINTKISTGGVSQTPIKINLNDNIYQNKEINISEASINHLLVIYQPSEGANYVDYGYAFYDEDKNVIISPFASGDPIPVLADKNLREPIMSEIFKVDYEVDVLTKIQGYVEDYFLDKEYSNEIKFEIPFEELSGESFEAWKFDNTFLGRKLDIFLPEPYNTNIPSLISKYEITSDYKVSITCGLVRTDLTTLLKINKGV
jgi:hypothetical protein